MAHIPSIEQESPEALKAVLIDAGLFLVAYELIRSHVVRPVEFFYADTTFGPGLSFIDFETDVGSRSKHRFDACLLWLRDHMKAITPQQYTSIHRVREFRDNLSHGIHKEIQKHNFREATALLIEARDALFALDNFWVRMEIQADPDFSHIKDWSVVHSGSFAMLDVLLKTVRPTG